MPPAYLRAPPLPSNAPTRLPGCTGKRGHPNEFNARKMMARLGGREVYQCRFCALWHITTRGKV